MITDLHRSNKSKPGRFSYKTEIDDVASQIINVVYDYRTRGYKVNAIYLGDIFDSSSQEVEKSLQEFNEFQQFNRVFDSSYSVVGNHEYTYYKDNPFWFCVNEIKSSRASSAKNNIWLPKGKFNLFTIPDILVSGNVEFIFNHYGCDPLIPSNDRISIGLFHQDIYFREVMNSVRSLDPNFYLLAENEAKCRPNYRLLDNDGELGNYQYCFFGHAHMMKGKWSGDCGTIYEYLGSLGRSSVKEVSNDFLDRNLPAVIIEDGKFQRIENNPIHLMEREKCVNEKVVERNHKDYEKRKEVKKMLSVKSSDLDDPVGNLKARLNDDYSSQIVDSLLNQEFNEYLIEFNNKLRKIRNDYYSSRK